MKKRLQHWRLRVLPVVLALSGFAVTCQAEDDSGLDIADISGLDIADTLARSAPSAPAKASTSSQQRIFTEATVSTTSQAGRSTQAARVSLDYFRRIGSGPRMYGIVSGRLDNSWGPAPRSSRDSVHTLRELYVEWQGSPNWIVNAGRINAQFGEAIAFNPTDFFREGSLRSVTSVLPSDLRDNRQGSVMLRMQRLWNGGSVTVIGSPRLPKHSSKNTFSLDLAATNPSQRWLVAISQKFGQQVTPQLVFAGGASQPPKVGFSVSWLPRPDTVAYVEANVARRPTTLASIGAWHDDTRLRPQVAVGAKWNATDAISINLELDVDKTAPGTAQVAALTTAPPAVRQAFIETLLRNQNLAYPRQLFVAATWKDLLGPKGNVSALARIDAQSRRGQYWIELRKRYGATELGAQFLSTPGSALQTRGAKFSFVLDHYF
ncbi:MAG: hypothetical protein LBE78_09060 [Burkholderiaceae bacterium]|jgi:hypothetical protein|nr:hypothetical protein [Burkholderiaceae bacterium]